ncbi:response regulator transcription factor [Clostridium sp. C8]|jgi:DNA-binding response OmpR family regulator|uniref:response regulator transcription factor n=1 Tax=Clostridium sp. C8 TaxID=1667357 RepID=UPI00062E76EB|nr:response regulator transcription factor [Clostridium sp. C8]KLE15345.1 transcriptional regulator [Clostridium sp. C8]
MITDEILNKKVLLVDDERELLTLLKEVFIKEGFRQIYEVDNGIDAILSVKEKNPDIIILDVNLPDIDGYKVCDRIRKFSTSPIIFLTAMGEDEEKIKGLEAGGDDYVTKPFNIKEVVLRVKSQLRRGSLVSEIKTNIYTFGNISINEETGEVKKGEENISLTAKEYSLILFLAKNINRVFSKSSLCEEVWGYEYDGYDNTIMVHIRHLREKLEDKPSDPKHIKTLKGIGYKLVD